MRIVYLANSRWPSTRGAGRLLLALLEHGRSEAHEVSVIAPASSALHRACTEAGIHSEAAEFTLAPSNVARLRALMRELHPDVVHGMSIFPVALVRWLRLVPDEARVCFFADVHVDPTSTLPVAARRFTRPLLFVRNSISRWEAPRLDAIFTASDYVTERLKVVGIRGHIVAAPGRIDAEKLVADATRPLELPPGGPRIGYAGYLEPLKGIDDLIVAFAEVARSYPEAQLLVAGDGPERSRLLDRAAQLGVADHVELLGFLDPVAPLLAALDIFASPSHSEAGGTIILEAMTLGVPCVCTDSGGPAEFMREGDNGLLVPPRDPEALAAAIVRLLAEPELASRLAERGRATVLEGPYLLSATLQTVFAEYERAAHRVGDAV